MRDRPSSTTVHAAPFLRFSDGDGRQQIVALPQDGRELAIGRDPGEGIPLPWDRHVSRVHAVLKRIGAAWTVVDDGLSRNGTYVNEVRVVGRRRLDDRDVVRCGGVTLEFRAPAVGEGEETANAPDDGGARGRHNATNKAIAAELSLSVDAVKTHLRRLAVVLEVDDLPQNRKRTELAWKALETGVVTARDLRA